MKDYNLREPSQPEIWKSGFPLLAYIAYPFAKPNPRKNTEEVRKIACEIMKKYPNVFIIVPHTAVDMTFFGDIPEKIEGRSIEDNLLAVHLEFTILSKIDLFILGCDLNYTVSSGMCWEAAFVRWLQIQGKQIVIAHVEELLK